MSLRSLLLPIAGLLSLMLGGCPSAPDASAQHRGGSVGTPAGTSVRLAPVSLSDSTHPVLANPPIVLEGAKDEWTSFALQLSDLPPGRPMALRLNALVPAAEIAAGAEPIPATHFEAWQILSMPVDLNRAGYVRHTGLEAVADRLPRALLPLNCQSGRVDLSTLRDPSRPTDRLAKPAANVPVQIWVDLHIPRGTPAGKYTATCDVVPANAADGTAVVSVPVELNVFNFSLPPERHLQMLSRIDWDALVRHYPEHFETVTPRLANRNEGRYADTVKTLDDLMKLALHHRVGLTVSRLQPTVKWPANIGNAPPQIDWTDFDAVIDPWLKGYNGEPGLGFWPLPEPDQLGSYDLRSRIQYWSQAATHFDQNEWAGKTALSMNKVGPGRVNGEMAIQLSSDAAQLLNAHGRLRVSLPVEDDQLLVAANVNNRDPRLISPAHTGRLMTASPGLVFSPPAAQWPQAADQPEHWLRTDLPGLTPYVGAGGDESDVRLWAWLAFLRQAKSVIWSSPLPTLQDPAAPADPNELIWFYPGQWFGVDGPVPTIQLKWLRRAQQDFEYLWLAKERGEFINALQMARLITKPVEIDANRQIDPTYSLMTGTSDRRAWAEAHRLLARTILVREPGKEADPAKQNELYLNTLQWARPQERPVLMGKTVGWSRDRAAGRGWVGMALALDVYNASDETPVGQLRWSKLPVGWEVRPQPIEVPAMSTYQVQRVQLDARFDLLKSTPMSWREPAELELTIDGAEAKFVSPLKLAIPVAASDRREGRFSFDGKLDDWTVNDLIQDGPMVRMLDRPAVQNQDLARAQTPSKLYTGWAADNFYVAFALDGVSKVDNAGRNFVDYQARRAWGEDLCEILIQPVYRDNTLGPTLHMVCKPNFSIWTERKTDPRTNVNPWEPFEGAGVRYAAAVDGPKWTGEVAIPWKMLADPKLGVPTLLRFNFAQHRAATGESATWAGPVDFGRDDAFTGLIHLRIPDNAGNDAVFNDTQRGSGVER